MQCVLQAPLAGCQHELHALEVATAELDRLLGAARANRNLTEQRAELHEQADSKQVEVRGEGRSTQVEKNTQCFNVQLGFLRSKHVC